MYLKQPKLDGIRNKKVFGLIRMSIQRKKPRQNLNHMKVRRKEDIHIQGMSMMDRNTMIIHIWENMKTMRCRKTTMSI